MLENVTFRASKVSLKNKTKTLVLFDVENKDVATFDCVHHVMLLDTSGSMWPHVDKLMDDVKLTLDMMDENDYLTIIRFSGAGQYRTILKGTKVSDKENIKKVLDTMKNAGGCTCFSDPIKELDLVITETLPMCSTYNVTIFTDGDTVTPWPVEEEVRRIFANLATVHDKIVAFNAIGYGEYYNRKLLLDMVNTIEYGEFAHASKIEDFHNIFSHQKEAVLDLRGKRLTFNVEGGSNAYEIIGLTSKTVKYGAGKMQTRLAKNRNLFGIFFDQNDGMLQFNDGSGHILTDLNKAPEADVFDKAVRDILYALAFKAFERGDKDESMEIFNYLGDKFFMDLQINAFTNGEVGAALDVMSNAVFGEPFRNTRSVPCNSYMPDENAYCVMDLLKDLVHAEAMYVPVKNYERVRRKRTDNFDLFVKDEEYDLAEMTGIVVGQERLNISIRFRVPGHIKLNPKRAKSVGLPNTVPACIFRNHAIIKDGHPNIEVLEVVLKKNKFDEDFVRTGKFSEIPCKVSIEDDCARLKITLGAMPVINVRYKKNATADYIHEMESTMLEIEAQNKIVNSIVTEEQKFSSKGDTDYTPEQIAVLVEHGMRTPGVYSAISTTQEEPEDYIIIREFKTQMKGFSSLPPISKAADKAKAGKKLTPSEAIVQKYNEALSDKEPTALLELKKKNDTLLKNIRFNLAAIKIATVLTGSWIPGFVKQDDSCWTYEKGDRILVAKLSRKEVAI